MEFIAEHGRQDGASPSLSRTATGRTAASDDAFHARQHSPPCRHTCQRIRYQTQPGALARRVVPRKLSWRTVTCRILRSAQNVTVLNEYRF